MREVRSLVTRILDIDMDFFLSDIAHWVDNSERLDSEQYVPWDEERFRVFLEERCRLNKDNPIKGRVIEHHDEAFHFWKELIHRGDLQTPFVLTHIDAHSDTGLGDANYVYIMKELLHHPMNTRLRKLNIKKVNYANYLAFTLALGWVTKVEFVLHPEWDNDFLYLHLKDFSDSSGSFQFKAYNKDIDIVMQMHRLLEIKPLLVDPEIPYSLIKEDEFTSALPYDLAVFCKSPGYTPKEADYMLSIFKEYIEEI
ncbi:hypothetical protein ET464_13780 [Paenibacillus protaetiae]|uniref:Uncharacterized protein n=1 Tax=Paenibacillus protaetiae TaxID=2509456 RepID=A0A4V0YFD3_9BACL|nr:hypothetical protein ET464_13780 [Paenibacillus protaetiae]